MANFKQLKERISMRDVLKHYELFDTLTLRGTSHRGDCPFCLTENTFSASLKKNCFNCFNESCPAHGDIIDFVMQWEDLNKKDTGDFLESTFARCQEQVEDGKRTQKPQPHKADSGKPVRQSGTEKVRVADTGSQDIDSDLPPLIEECLEILKETLDEIPANPPLGFSLKGIDPSHKVVSDLGITEANAINFGAGFYSGNSKQFKDHVVIPIHNVDKELVGYTGIDPESEKMEHIYPEQFRKELAFFNPLASHGDVYNDEHGQIITRDPHTVLLLHQAGFERSIAFMDNCISDEHVKFLIRTCGVRSKITLLCSHDDEYIVENIGKLFTLFFVRLRRYEKTNDTPAGFTSDDAYTILN